jgi:hypothetical protein
MILHRSWPVRTYCRTSPFRFGIQLAACTRIVCKEIPVGRSMSHWSLQARRCSCTLLDQQGNCFAGGIRIECCNIRLWRNLRLRSFRGLASRLERGPPSLLIRRRFGRTRSFRALSQELK